MKYSVVVTTFNRPDLTKVCVRNAITKAGKDFELVWVDDNSPEPEVKKVMESFCPSKKVLRKENGGWAVATNDGIQAATGDFIFILDNDWFLPENWLATMDSYIQKIPETGGIAMEWKGFELYGWTGKEKDIRGTKVISVNTFIGFRGFSRKVLDKVGYLDERFGWWGPADTDWSIRALRTGELFYFIPNEYVWHAVDNLNRSAKDSWSSENNERLRNKLRKDKSIYYSPYEISGNRNNNNTTEYKEV